MSDPTRLRSFTSPEYRSVHDLIFPADIRDEDRIKAWYKTSSTIEEWLEVKLWRLSPLGVELLVEASTLVRLAEVLDLRLQLANGVSILQGIVVANDAMIKGKRLIALRLHQSTTKRTDSENRRRESRWICSSQFHPVAVAPNPIVYNDFLYFTIRDISAVGFRAYTSLRNKVLVPGMRLDLQTSFPMVGYVHFPVQIARTALSSENGKDYLEVGMQFESLSKSQRETIGQYLVQFSNAISYEELKGAGLRPLSLYKAVNFFFIKTKDDFLQALELRYLANAKAGKIPESYAIERMADSYDSKSRIIGANFKGKMVGTIRLGFPEGNERLELEKYVELPDWFPRKDEILECSRAATHPEYRKGDLWYSLIQQTTVSALQAKRRYAVLSTTPELVAMYKRIGFKEAGKTFVMPLYPDMTQHLLILDLPRAVSGGGVGLLAWTMVWKPVAEYVWSNHIFGSDAFLVSKMRLYKILSPLAKFFILLGSLRSRRA
ncbi:MAG: GNAT family N-acetyltransferase [Pseudomonadales bacterium]|nr:GNAT family N-acetyltransferase [Pseudomonadales bacterium]